MSPGRSTRTQVAMSKFLLSGCSLEYRFIDVQDEETDGTFVIILFGWALIRAERFSP